jgi:hypothetical protein
MDGSSLTDGPLEPTGASEAVQAFEHACEALQSAEAGARQGAEAHLLQLRAPGAAHEAIELCRRVLLLSGGSARPLAQFHAALTLRDVVMRDWEALSEEPVAGMGGGGVAITGVLREEILHSTVQRLCSPPGAQPFLRQQLLQLVALLHKRAWLMPAAEGGGGAGLQQRALQLCAGGQPPQSQALGLQLLEAVLSEFSFSRLTAVGMTVEFHIEARLTFQRGQLLAYVRAHAVTPCSQRAHTGWAVTRLRRWALFGTCASKTVVCMHPAHGTCRCSWRRTGWRAGRARGCARSLRSPRWCIIWRGWDFPMYLT